jgi:hypothetical protein
MTRILDKVNGGLAMRRLSRRRIMLAVGIAVLADGLQLAFSFVGWLGPNQIIDVLVMFLLIPLIGFHLLLLPSFVLELVPVLDDLPTWTACVLAVAAIRRHKQNTIEMEKIAN